MVRDAKGRFVPGVSGNPKGRKPRATEDEYRDAILDIVPIERWRLMIEKQAARAEKGRPTRVRGARQVHRSTHREHDITTDGEPIRFIEKVTNAGNGDA